ncbi:MAG TPA: C25 family cysteine peptidase [Dongiaceae bacterium]|jgi:hypothetical protein|nr:C25 family cysteine peptidase [Dongiaceae bacterium]
MRCECSHADEHSKSIRVEVAFDPDTLHLRSTPFGTEIELQGAKATGEIGGPALPRLVVKVAVPPLKWPTKMEIVREHFVPVTREAIFIAPVQPRRPGALPAERDYGKAEHEVRPEVKWSAFCKRPEHEREEFTEPFPIPAIVHPDPQLYEKAMRSPRPAARPLSLETIGLTRIARIELNPVRQNAAGQLELCTRCEIAVTYGEERPLADKQAALKKLETRLGRRLDPSRLMPQPEPVVTSRQHARKLADLARSEVINADVVVDLGHHWPYYELPADYLIITDNRAWDAATITPGAAVPGMVEAFQKLAAWKNSRGVTAKVVTISNIVDGRYGDFRSGSRDLQEVIRKFLKAIVPTWGVSWLLVGGDVGIVPIRKVAGSREGFIDVGTDNPPKDNKSFWTGSHLKMNVVNPGVWWPGLSPASTLVNPANGQIIPYDAAGTSNAGNPGWYFTTSNLLVTDIGDVDLVTTDVVLPHGAEADAGVLDPYAVHTSAAGSHVRVNGPAWLVNAQLQWLYEWNTIPTDFYYSSLESYIIGEQEIDIGIFSFSVPYVWYPDHDWDAGNNGLYGQHNYWGDLDGVVNKTDISVGRAPVESATQAEAFVKKVIAYESFHSPDNGLLLDVNWPRRVVLASSNWDPNPAEATSTATNPPEDGRYHHEAAAQHSVIKLAQAMAATNLQLIAEISETDRRVIPYNSAVGDGGYGWHFAWGPTSLAASEIPIPIGGGFFQFPIPSQWIAVFAPAAELTPQRYVLLNPAPDLSMSDQEQLRGQLQSELPKWDSYMRLYEDELDLTPAQAGAAPVQHLTWQRLQAALNAKPHIMSLSGHGNSDGCCGGSVWLANSLTNGYETFIGYADSCLTNQVDASDAFSEALVYNPNGGAVAYVGNTRFSWIGNGDDFQRAFFHRLTAVDHLGWLNDSRCGLLGHGNYPPDERWTIFALNLLGCPEMKVRKGPLRFFGIYVGDDVVTRLGRHPIKIKVVETRPPKPVPPDPPPLTDVLVHIRQGERIMSARTDHNGEVRFDLSGLDSGEVELTVSQDGFVPYMLKTRIAGDWARGVVTEISHRMDGQARSLIRLRGEDGERSFYASGDSPDYRLILDAAENAFLSQEPISLWVDSLEDGGMIERFRFAR